jgi:iron complex transport system substrate-binding protein
MRYPTVDAEWVLKENPEVIIFPAFDYFTGYLQTDSSNSTKYIEEAKIRSGLNGTDAAENDRLYVIDAYLIEAARGFIGAQYLAKWLYPELFEDLNPEEIHQEYFESWLGVPYKGIWAYPLAE